VRMAGGDGWSRWLVAGLLPARDKIPKTMSRKKLKNRAPQRGQKRAAVLSFLKRVLPVFAKTPGEATMPEPGIFIFLKPSNIYFLLSVLILYTLCKSVGKQHVLHRVSP